jgi:hypothetical protein
MNGAQEQDGRLIQLSGVGRPMIGETKAIADHVF